MGEVLKFIGDALLAIFPLTGANDTLIADRAMAGAREAAAAIDAMSEKRRAIGQSEIRFGLALHVGEVLYGARSLFDWSCPRGLTENAARVKRAAVMPSAGNTLS
jgi:adenylate cyclase